MARILIADDQKNMRATLAIMLKSNGHEVEEAQVGSQACKMVQMENFDLVLTDLKMGDINGIEVLKKVKEVSPLTEVIVMTAYGTVESAVEAMKIGAYDYITKPFSEEELVVRINKALERRWLSGEVSLLTQQFKDRYKLENIVGRSPMMRDIIIRVLKIAPTDATVLITGESGTGKELIAKAIHANSNRSDRPFITVNCATISEQLLESELFGHIKGSFTGAVSTRKGLFEEADGGTFFFDEIAETTITFQAKLLRAIQEHEIRRVGDNKPIKVDVRILAATNQNLKQAIADKRFREDLYYRLNVVRLYLPPLKERKEDIPMIVEHFLTQTNRKMRKNVIMTKEVMNFLMNYDYPGNIRELENMIEQGVALSSNGEVRLNDVIPEDEYYTSLKENYKLQDLVDSTEKRAIIIALNQTKTLEETAELLDLSLTTLWRKMKRLGIKHKRGTNENFSG